MVASFVYQIQSEYYGGNISVSIEAIILEHFNDTNHYLPLYTPQSRTLRSMFHSFLSGNSKQDTVTIAAHIKRIFLQRQRLPSRAVPRPRTGSRPDGLVWLSAGSPQRPECHPAVERGWRRPAPHGSTPRPCPG